MEPCRWKSCTMESHSTQRSKIEKIILQEELSTRSWTIKNKFGFSYIFLILSHLQISDLANMLLS
uniref:Uncharacterized protein n=1 Tax=Arundo donax TaxID=35708 RepID=A0A0A9HG82_ARUDO